MAISAVAAGGDNQLAALVQTLQTGANGKIGAGGKSQQTQQAQKLGQVGAALGQTESKDGAGATRASASQEQGIGTRLAAVA